MHIHTRWVVFQPMKTVRRRRERMLGIKPTTVDENTYSILAQEWPA